MDKVNGQIEQDALVSQAEFDNTMDIRRLLRTRGAEPGETAPTCDMCLSWTASHVIGDFLVCDKPKCQDTAEAAMKEDEHNV